MKAYALIIGNSAYYEAALDNAVNDAKAMADKLGAPDKPCGVGRADANPKLLLNDT